MNTNNTTKKALSFGKGLTNTPSDLISTDEELTESAGVIMKNGEMMPIQKPAYAYVLNDDELLMYVHKGVGFCNHVTFNKTTKEICFYLTDGVTMEIIEVQKFTIETNIVKSITSINNICVVTTKDKRLYFLFKKKKYIMFGDLPELYVCFSLTRDGDTLDLLTKKSEPADFKGLAEHTFPYYAVYSLNANMTCWELKAVYQNGHQEVGSSDETTRYNPFLESIDNSDDVQTACAGNVAKIWKLAKEKQRFLHPFFVRYALLLYDGTYARISNPIAVYPSVTRNGYLTPVRWVSKEHKFAFDDIENVYTYSLNAFKYKLSYYIQFGPDWKAWKDIIKEVVVFATEEVTPFKSDTHYIYKDNPMDTLDTLVSDCIAGSDSVLFKEGYNTIKWRFGGAISAKMHARPIFLPGEYKTESEIIDEMLTKTRFYKIFSVDVDKIQPGILLDAPIKTGILENLEEQEQLPNDDYFGWTHMIDNGSYSYNQRLNLINVIRYPFVGFDYFTAGDSGSLGRLGVLDIYVHIVSNTMDTWVMQTSMFLNVYTANSWLYYPDPNATEMIVYNSGTEEAQRIPLKRHPALNGAYSFRHLPNKKTFESGNADDSFDDTPIELPNVDTEAYETLGSQIFTSVVNNPFVFQANGDNTVGTGTILGITANTEPISQGQFGQYPLLVFTTEGIYGLSVDSEGLYAASFPMSREVCNNAKSITPTGRLVFFTSEKGLMAMSGGTVQCVSTQLQGATPRNFNIVGDGNFRAFLKDCMLAYDYRDSLIRIYSPTYDYHYVYSMDDQTFAKASNENTTVLTTVSSYPDSLVQEADGKVYSMLSKPDINEDTNTYSGTFITRPLKLGSSLELKTIRQILHFFNSDEGKFQLRIFGSNDCRTWCELKSIHGKPWLFYVFRYDLSNLKASDSFAGTAVAIETRFNDKMR